MSVKSELNMSRIRKCLVKYEFDWIVGDYKRVLSYYNKVNNKNGKVFSNDD